MALEDELDQMFVILMGMIVMFMQCGFAFYECGTVRSKNTTNILLKNVLDSYISGIAYWLFGYAFAYGEGNDFIGYDKFALKGLPDTGYANFFFQYSFAATTATIVSGSVAERCEFSAYLIYSFFITGFIYPIVSHWQWGGGFLGKGIDYGGDIGRLGYIDFAGSGIVHVLGGVAGFVGAAILGPRIGRFDKETKSAVLIRGHSVPVAALGGFILFFGFIAFNGGSLGSLTGPGNGATISLVVVNTVISGSFGAFSAMMIHSTKKFGSGKFSLLMTINGALTGMVAVCASVNAIYPWTACILGIAGGPVYHLVSYLVRRVGVDDPLDAVAVHFGGGVLGVLSLPFFHRDEGIFYNWNKRSGLVLGWEIAGLGIVILWTAITTGILFGAMRLLKILRVPEDVEIKGLDIEKHEPAYPVEAYGHGHVEKLLQIISTADTDKVKQALRNLRVRSGVGYKEIKDQGPYENPEVQSSMANAGLAPHIAVTQFVD